MMRYPHLSDDRLIDVCLDRAPAATERQHLESCDVCEGRRASLARLLADASGVARAEADAVFEKGPATLRIQTVRRAGQWKLLEVYVQSDSLLG